MATPSPKQRSPSKTPNSNCESFNSLSTVQLKELKNKITNNKKKKPATDYISYALLLVVLAITIIAFPEDFLNNKLDVVKLNHVFYYGWITAISTGLGVLPFFFFDEPNKFWMAVSNALAGGMMLSASYSLAMEGVEVEPSTYTDDWPYSVTMNILGLLNISEVYVSIVRTILGFAIGLFFILVMQYLLTSYEDLKLGGFEGASAQKMILILFVMTLHSLSEGIGIGVSFGGSSGAQLGQFISLSLAVHNVPEGLAVALVLTSRKVSKLRTVLWAIFTSLPQPITAIPAFLFVEKFTPLLPIGLGFAAGAMTYVAIFELLSEAVADSDILTTATIGTLACLLMNFLQNGVKGIL